MELPAPTSHTGPDAELAQPASRAVWLPVIAASAALSLLSAWLLLGRDTLGRRLVRASYDLSLSLTSWFRDTPTNLPVTIVYLDRESYSAESQDPAQPWDRALHAKLVRRLQQAGARLVVFDILFTAPGPDPVADLAFAAALRGSGRVVLAGEVEATSQADGSGAGFQARSISPPVAGLGEAAQGWGLTSLQVDEDFVVRRLFAGYPGDGAPSLAWAAVQRLAAGQGRAKELPEGEAWMRYYGRPYSVPHIGYSRALDPSVGADHLFRDRLVFVGARPMTGGFLDRRDEFRSPYYSRGDREQFYPGVELHAIAALNLWRGDWLVRLPRALEVAVLSATSFVLMSLCLRRRPTGAAGTALGAEMVLALAVPALLLGARTWFPWLLVGAVQVPAALGTSVIARSVEWYRQRRELEAARREAQARIREQAALIEKARDAIVVTELAGGVSYANPSAQALFGPWLEARPAGGPFPECCALDASVVAEARAHVLQHGEWAGEIQQRASAGGDVRWVDHRWTLIAEEGGRPGRVLMLCADVTEKRALELQLLRAQRMETIGALAGGMAHDLNNALAPILMGVQMLRRRLPDPETRRMLEVMETNTDRGAGLVRQVLLFARGRAGERRPVAPGDLLREMEHLVRETFPRNIAVEVLVAEDVGRVEGEPTQLHQVLLNLCVNARDAMPQGGRLTLAADVAEVGPEGLPGVRGAALGSYVVLLVSDTGTGIPAAVRERVFEPFFTTKAEGQGTGLGLSTVASIARQHGGFVRLESVEGEGSTFEVYLPHCEPGAAVPDAGTAPSPPRGEGQLVLVVDDEESVREMLQLALADQGYRVLCAGEGSAALATAARHAGELRLVLLDSDMPGMGGRETLAGLRRLKPDVPVVWASGQRLAAGEVPGGPADPHVDHLAKPFRLEDLFWLLARRTGNPTGPGGTSESHPAQGITAKSHR